ncbi:polyketide synthase [Aspergillus neoniger CBS 115656]|uniref:Polyketide synthase n=1 Tax=Aspergillus neoniger (strain CBS 115656) TaxID=1448310 RepID=A0A318YJ34_ASPNB|nr:polyketide synthase [Aspergillus neoniger CBS 115656]PYH34376.1 polyketide synthase [Aspergillus neoniger CBS 115656]
MVSLEATGAETTAAMSFLHVQDKVDIAGYNTPMQTVVSGDKQAIEVVAAHFAGKLGRKVKMLDLSQAFHSSHMDDMLPLFRAVVKTLQFSRPKLPVISSLTGLLAEEGQLEQPEYWVQQARQAVRFSDSIQTIYHQHGIDIFLELGPHPVLLGLTAACLTSHQCHDDDDNASPLLLPSLRTGKQDDISVVRRSLAELHVRNVPIDWLAYFKPWGCQLVTLPTYAFQRDRWFRQLRAMSVGLNGNTVVGNDQADGPPSSGDTDRFQFEVVWHRLNKENVQLKDSSRSWGLICPAGNGKWASTVTRALSQTVIRLTRVQRLEEAQQLDGLLCLWDTSSSTDIPRQASQHTTQALTQLQMAATTSFPLPLVWVTCQAVGTGGYDADPGQMNGLGTGPLWGLMRTARNEHPDLRLRLIDLDEDKGAPEALLLALTLSEEPECAVRQGQVFMPRLQQVKKLKPVVEQQRHFLRQDGAVLITGGLGGIGKRVARWLATTHHVHDLVLISRRGMEDSGAAAFVAELLKLVMAMFSVQRPLRGVIHAAGVVDNGILSAMTPQRCATTSAPKQALK